MASYLPVLQSILPFRSSPPTASLPEVGSPAPKSVQLGSVDLATLGKPALVAFVRHCGCPFAEKEVRLLGEQSRRWKEEGKQLHIIIVQHSEEKETKEWFETLGAPKLFPDASSYTLVSDPDRKIYAAWGIGQLGWTGMVNGSVMESLKSLKASDGIDLRTTGKGSYRWQNSGGFAVDAQGIVRWSKIAKESSDMCDYAAAAKTIQ